MTRSKARGSGSVKSQRVKRATHLNGRKSDAKSLSERRRAACTTESDDGKGGRGRQRAYLRGLTCCFSDALAYEP